MLIDGLELCGLLWCFYQLFVLHSDGTHSVEDPLVSDVGECFWLNYSFKSVWLYSFTLWPNWLVIYEIQDLSGSAYK